MKDNPQFCWILRDFHLELANELGLPITANEYMENCLHSNTTNIKDILTQYFSTRSCYTFVKPFEGRE